MIDAQVSYIVLERRLPWLVQLCEGIADLAHCWHTKTEAARKGVVQISLAVG